MISDLGPQHPTFERPYSLPSLNTTSNLTHLLHIKQNFQRRQFDWHDIMHFTYFLFSPPLEPNC